MKSKLTLPLVSMLILLITLSAAHALIVSTLIIASPTVAQVSLEPKIDLALTMNFSKYGLNHKQVDEKPYKIYNDERDPHGVEAGFDVGILWYIVKQKHRAFLLPEDTIAVCVRFKCPIATTPEKPLVVNITVKSHDLYIDGYVPIKNIVKNLAVPEGVHWINFTIQVPWTDKLYINAVLFYGAKNQGYNEVARASTKIEIAPNAKLVSVSSPPCVVTEDEIVNIKVLVKTNIDPDYGARISVTLVDETTKDVISSWTGVAEPNMTIEFSYAAPQNPELIPGIEIREPVTKHLIEVMLTGYDSYGGDNTAKFTITVVSKATLLTVLYASMVSCAITVLCVILTLIILIKTRKIAMAYMSRPIRS